MQDESTDAVPSRGLAVLAGSAVLARILGPRAELVYKLARIAAGLMFAFDCVQILLSVLADVQAPAGHGDWLGTGFELLTAWLSRPSPAREGARLVS